MPYTLVCFLFYFPSRKGVYVTSFWIFMKQFLGIAFEKQFRILWSILRGARNVGEYRNTYA